MTNFKNLNLNDKIIQALESKGYETPTPIQLQAIPHVLEQKDLFGIAQTGTGKTAAFSLPLLHNLAKSGNKVKSGHVRALILTPTRELASQIADNIELYSKGLGLRHAVVFGGVSERPQITAMQRGVDILIATPGRLLDLSEQGYIRFMQVETLVLDEADRMLDMGFVNDIKKVIKKIPERRQTLLFSATMPNTIMTLANSILKDPVKVEVTPPSTTVEKIDQKVLFVEKANKPALLKRLLKDEAVETVLIFSRTKFGANRVVEALERSSIRAEALHGNKSQSARERALESFREGKIKVLVATDIAARGIDIPTITHVINYDIPDDPESYVHRIGRTARAGRKGIALSLCDPSEIKALREVEKVIKYKIPVDETHPFHGVAAPPRSATSSNDRRRDSYSKPRSKSGQRSSKSDSRSKTRSSGDHDKKGIFGIFGGKKKKPDSRKDSNSRFSRDDEGYKPRRSSEGRDDRRSDSRRGEGRSSSYRNERFANDGRRSSSRDDRFSSDRRDDRRDDRKPRSNSSSRSGDDDFSARKTFGFGGLGLFKTKKSGSRTSSKGSPRPGSRSGERRSDSDFGNRSRSKSQSDSRGDSRSSSSRSGGSYSSAKSGSGTRKISSSGSRRNSGGSSSSRNKKW